MGYKGHKYNGAIDRVNVKYNSKYVEKKTGSIIKAFDISTGDLEFMYPCDYIYTDMPYNTAMCNGYYTKADIEKKTSFLNLLNITKNQIKKINPRVCFIEVGKQNFKNVASALSEIYTHIDIFDITYYKTKPCKLIRGSNEPNKHDYTGLDDMFTPMFSMDAENAQIVGDLMFGRGLVFESAFKFEKKFLGTELNINRVAVTMEKIINRGGQFKEV